MNAQMDKIGRDNAITHKKTRTGRQKGKIAEKYFS